MVNRIERFADSVIGLFSPKREAQRLYYRHRVQLARQYLQRYAAGKTFRQSGDWTPASQSINDLLTMYNATIRGRVRQLIRDFPYFKRALQVLIDYCVGDGLELQARTKKLDGSFNLSLNQKIEDAWKFWGDEADFNGKLHLYEMMRLGKRQEVETGEFIVVRTGKDTPGRYLPLALQMYEADWVTDIGVNPADGNKINQGVEYNPKTGEPVAYHFTDPDSWGKSIRVEADRVLHGFETLRPGQFRGISLFAPAVMVAHDLSDYMDAEIDAAKMAARYLAFIETPDIAGFQQGRAKTPSETTDTVKKIEEMETALIEYLNPGEKVHIASHERGGSNFEAFARFILRMICVATDVPYELLSGDYGQLNYSSLRGVRNDMQKHFLPMQRRHVRQFCSPVHRWFMDATVLNGRLALTYYMQNPWPYLDVFWQTPGLEAIDPLRESKADVDRIDNLLVSPQEITARRGRNYEDVLDELEEAERMQKERNLEVKKKTSTSVAGNPAAVAKQ